MASAVMEAPVRERIEPAWDLVDGVLVERDMGNLADFYATRLLSHLSPYVDRERLGVTQAMSAGYQYPALDHGRLRVPDLSFVRRDKLKDGLPAEGWADYPPDLVVEAVSRNDNAESVHHKSQVWLDGGVRLVWVLYPKERQIVVHHPDRTSRTYSVGEEITGEDVVPGFSVPLAAIFADP